MNKDLQVILDDQKVVGLNAQNLIEAFGAPFTEAGEILASYKKIEVTDESQKDVMALARSNRLILKKIRTTVENKRKELKEDSLRTGKAIDGVAKYIRDTIQPAEEYLELQERFIEIKQAEAALARKTERLARLSPLVEDVTLYNYESMTNDQFNELIVERTAVRKAIEEAKAKEEADRVAQEKARAEEQERIRKENIRLKKEADEREVAISKEREAERLRFEAERKKVEDERRKREAIEEAAAKAEADAEARERAVKEAEQDALRAPDKDKLLNFVDELSKVHMPNMSTKETAAFAERITSHLATTLKTYIDTIEAEL